MTPREFELFCKLYILFQWFLWRFLIHPNLFSLFPNHQLLKKSTSFTWTSFTYTDTLVSCLIWNWHKKIQRSCKCEKHAYIDNWELWKFTLVVAAMLTISTHPAPSPCAKCSELKTFKDLMHFHYIIFSPGAWIPGSTATSKFSQFWWSLHAYHHRFKNYNTYNPANKSQGPWISWFWQGLQSSTQICT